jgi:hypothetical protein
MNPQAPFKIVGSLFDLEELTNRMKKGKGGKGMTV